MYTLLSSLLFIIIDSNKIYNFISFNITLFIMTKFIFDIILFILIITLFI